MATPAPSRTLVEHFGRVIRWLFFGGALVASFALAYWAFDDPPFDVPFAQLTLNHLACGSVKALFGISVGVWVWEKATAEDPERDYRAWAAFGGWCAAALVVLGLYITSF